MRGNAITGLGLLAIALVGAVALAFGLYVWDAGARAAEASLRPQPVAPLAASSPAPAPVAQIAASPQAASVPGAPGDAAAGQTLFQATCNACHPSARAGIGPA